MNSELQRIKSKDYVDLDERLFSNLSNAGELDSTINKLMQLQHYLRNQIDQIQDQQQKQAVMKASQIVLADVAPQVKGQTSDILQKLTDFNEEINRVQKYLKKSKDYIVRQQKLFWGDLQDIYQDGCSFILQEYARKCNENGKLKERIYKLQAQIKHSEKFQSLNKPSSVILDKQHDNIPISNHNTHFQQNKFHFHSYSRSNGQLDLPTEPGNQVNQKEKIIQFYSNKKAENATPRLPMPLRKNSNIISNYDEKYRNESRNSLYETPRQQNTIKRCSSFTIGHDQSGARQLTLQTSSKENLMLLKKGATIKERKKSTKKLKVFSHF